MRGLILGSAALATVCSGVLANPVEREGRGSRREALNAIEATPFDVSALEFLRDWTNGDALTPDDLQGSVVMLITLDIDQPSTMVLSPSITRLERAHAGDGLIVVGIHPDAGWDRFQTAIDRGMIGCTVARDSYGRLREVIRADNDPDIYLIDRAGQLRYADIANTSMKDAVEELLGETAEHARGEAQRRTTTDGRIAAGLERGARQSSRSAEPEESAEEATSGITIPAAMYNKADWPKHNPRGRLSAKSYQGKSMPAEFGNEDWLTDEVSTQGKVIVIDFWATWCGPCKRAAPTLDKLQKAHRKELAVLAISGSGENASVVKKYLKRNKHSYAYLHDDDQTLNNAFGVRGIPHTVVLSTDGTVRWQGNPLNGDFTKIVKQVIKADPVVQARKRGQSVAYDEDAFVGIDSDANSSATVDAWPAHNEEKLFADNDLQGEALETPLSGLRWIAGSSRPETEGKVVVIDFWATWCGPCKNFSPRLDKLQKKFADDVVAIGIAGQNDKIQVVESYLSRTSHSYLNAYDSNQRLYKSIGVQGIPHVLILSSDGVVRWQGYPGNVDFETVLEEIVVADREMRAEP